MRILIAEDDLTSRTILSSVLKKFGHEVVETKNGVEAFESLQAPDAPRLAILDWMMPKMDGVEVCRRIRSLATTDPPYLILLTARDDSYSIVQGLETGANDYLTKPFSNSELRARVGVGMRMLELQTNLNKAMAALSHEAARDALTGMRNRRAILGALARELARSGRHAVPLSVGLCDIDHFKNVNDRYGHLVGDDVLRGFARIIENSIRTYDLAGRYGGEEFLIVAPGCGDETGGTLYERIRATVAATEIETRIGPLRITISIGVAGCGCGTGKSDTAGGAKASIETVDELLAAADSALYRAKAEGRNRVAFARFMNPEDPGRPRTTG